MMAFATGRRPGVGLTWERIMSAGIIYSVLFSKPLPANCCSLQHNGFAWAWSSAHSPQPQRQAEKSFLAPSRTVKWTGIMITVCDTSAAYRRVRLPADPLLFLSLARHGSANYSLVRVCSLTGEVVGQEGNFLAETFAERSGCLMLNPASSSSSMISRASGRLCS